MSGVAVFAGTAVKNIDLHNTSPLFSQIGGQIVSFALVYISEKKKGSTQFFLPKATSAKELINLDRICPIVYALSIIGQKWKIPILWHLADEGTLRYNELKRGVHGITNIMLTKSLQELEEHHLVHREQYDAIPPKVEYSLTERGKTLIPLLREFDAWGKKQIEIYRFPRRGESCRVLGDND